MWRLLRVMSVRGQHTRAAREWGDGDKLHNYTVKRVVEVAEMDLKAVHLRHVSGGEHLHVCKADSDNVFAVAFKTTPHDSTGVAHILEHVSLCGSEKFPVKDPFFKMLTRSLATFMNAFTANDWTMYPFSTQNASDFGNLMQVYLDAVFKPLLTRHDFEQEGWRLEHADTNIRDSELVLKGVVFNEMKGVFDDPHQVFSQAVLNHLHPTTTYSHVSGGDPSCIPNLSWQALKDFHAHHYHHSNARFFTYGDIPLEQHLHTIDTYLASITPASTTTTTAPSTTEVEPRWTSPRHTTITCPQDPLSPHPSSTVSVNYLLCDVKHTQLCFELSFLSSLLLNGPHTPLYQGLIESGLGADYSSNTGFNDEARDVSFSVGVQRVNPDRVGEVEGVVAGVLEGAVVDGFPQQQIDALLHRIKLSLLHQTSQHGLKLILSIIPAWNHASEPIHLLQVNKMVGELKRKLVEDPKHLQHLLKKHLIDNNHKLTLIANPPPPPSSSSSPQPPSLSPEQHILKNIISKLSGQDREEIWRQGQESAREDEDLESLPRLQLFEVNRTHERDSVVRERLGDMAVHTCTQDTNGVTYVRMLMDASHLEPYLVAHLPLWSHLLTNMGTQHSHFRDQAQQVELRSGGLSASPIFTPHPSLPHSLQLGILLSSHSLHSNLPHMLHLWTDILKHFSLSDTDRLNVLLSSLAAESSSGLSHNGHHFAMLKSSSTLSGLSQLQEQCSGVSQLSNLKQLLASPPQQVVAAMEQLSQQLLASCRLVRSCIHAQPSSMPSALEGLHLLQQQLPSTPQTGGGGGGGDGDGGLFEERRDIRYISKPHTPTYEHTHVHVASQVNHVAKSFSAPPFNHPDYPPLKLLASILSHKFLHSHIREKGGAYGAGCKVASNAVQFFSYRDPNLTSTLDAFSNSAKWATEQRFSETDLHEAKLAVFSQVDKPSPPGSRALRGFLEGIGEEEWHAFRQGLFEARSKDVARVAKLYLSEQSCTSLIGPAIKSATLDWNHITTL